MQMGSVQNPVRRGRASSLVRAGCRVKALSLAALCLAALLTFTGCDLPGLGVASDASATPPTPSATATPVPWMGAPHALPAGWTAHYAPHFSIALPPEWRIESLWVHKDPRPEWWRMEY